MSDADIRRDDPEGVRAARTEDRPCFAHPVLVAQIAAQIHCANTARGMGGVPMSTVVAVVEARSIVDYAYSTKSDVEIRTDNRDALFGLLDQAKDAGLPSNMVGMLESLLDASMEDGE